MAKYCAMSQQGDPEQASLLLYEHRANETTLPPLPPCGMRLCYSHHANSICAYTYARGSEQRKKEPKKEIYRLYRAMQIVSGYQAKEHITARPYEYSPTSLNRHANHERG